MRSRVVRLPQRRWMVTGVVGITAMIATACGSDSDPTPTPVPTTATTAPSELTVGGQAISDYFQGNCAVCHGGQREGLIGPALTVTALTQGDEFYIDTIRNGRPGTAMPGFALPEDELQALVGWLKRSTP